MLPGVKHRVLSTGEAVLLDERDFKRFSIEQSAGIMHWNVPTDWLLARVQSPRRLLGEPTRAPCKWSEALNAFLAQWTLDLVRSGPVSPAALAEQIGTLLALIAERDLPGAKPFMLPNDLCERARARIQERCSEATLSVADVSRNLGVSARTLHRALANRGDNFGVLLVHARIRLAERMLASPNLSILSLAEIGKRAGFKDPSHFAKSFRRLRGRSPAEARRLARDGAGSGENGDL
ncbi:AraC family transcriptional regulator [Dyella sp. C11]|uniref:helix-turn-helix transcriptional regulator n=1 Tax=Dyella sp. C11 TaxID=2126991 RepID=UPI001300AE68|nr:AraC family transcriptional regulator [Dyella sp. C11]